MLRVGIIGGSGFVGGTLVQLLIFHKNIELSYVTSRSQVGKYVSSQIPTLRGLCDIKFELPNNEMIRNKCDLVFTAVPHKASHEMMKDVLECGVKVIDCSADFRLRELSDYKQYYGDHSCPELLKTAVYGMPELHREEIKKATLVAVPGCQASSAIYALAPLIKNKLVFPTNIIVDSKTGSSGSGAEISEASHHPIRANSIRPYALTGHRHTAEIEQELSLLYSQPKGVTIGFSAHGVNLVRGILSTCYTFFSDDHRPEEKDVIKAYRSFYREEKFVRFMRLVSGVFRLPDPKLIMGTNYCDIGFQIDDHINRVIAVSALDNLVKGTAGNAIQCMNLMNNFPEEMGLEFPGIYPY